MVLVGVLVTGAASSVCAPIRDGPNA